VTSFLDVPQNLFSILKAAESDAKMDLDAFLSQFVLIKTPYGYILARAPQQVTQKERKMLLNDTSLILPVLT